MALHDVNIFSLPPNRTSDSGSNDRFFSPFPTTIRALHFFARIPQPFLPSSTHVELRLPTSDSLSSVPFYIFCNILRIKRLTTVGLELKRINATNSTRINAINSIRR